MSAVIDATQRAGKDVACLVCGGSTDVVLDDVTDVRFGVPGTFAISRCTCCRLEQTTPRLPPADLAATYERYYNFRDADTGTYARRRGAVVRSGLYRLWVRLDGDISFVLTRGAGRRLLDVGCNEGRNLDLFARGGFQAEGVEPNPTAARVARSRGLFVHDGGIGDLAADAGPFDVIVLSNVLEHDEAPAQMLAAASRHLAPGGELCVSCPNAASWSRRLFGRAWINWHPPFHLTHFTAETLRSLLEGNGFEVVEVGNRTPALWLAQSALALRYAAPGRPTLEMRRPLIVGGLMLAVRFGLFPLLWLANLLGRGECLVVRARK